MNYKLQMYYREKKRRPIFLLFCGIGVFFFFASSSFAAFSTSPNAPTSELPGGAYTNWLQETLEASPPTDKNPLLDGNAVKKSNALSSEEGEKGVVVNGQNVGVGTQTPSSTLDIRGTHGGINLFSSTENVRLLFKNNMGVFVQAKKFFLGNASTKIEILMQKINVPGILHSEGKNVVPGEQKCPVGQKIVGTDEEGKIICREGGGAPLDYCNANDQVPTAAIRPVGMCILAEA